jgi:hypothetical protein
VTAVPNEHEEQEGEALVESEAEAGGKVRYDLVKEFVIALVAVSLITVLVSALFSSPDKAPVTIASWSKADPVDFVTTADAELGGSSTTAQYGPPYNSASPGQKIGPLSLQRYAGVRQPVDTARDFVIGPLQSVRGNPTLSQALATYQQASADQQQRWTKNLGDALSHATVSGDTVRVPSGDYGPVPTLVASLRSMAQSGGLDGYLLSTPPSFYNSNYTKPLLFLNDGTYLADQAKNEHLQGKQWGMMNETGSYPGQAWLWLYTMWYQIPPFSSSGNADALVWGIMFVLTLALILVPFIPGLRSLPRWVPVYRLIWREHYRRLEGEDA